MGHPSKKLHCVAQEPSVQSQGKDRSLGCFSVKAAVSLVEGMPLIQKYIEIVKELIEIIPSKTR